MRLAAELSRITSGQKQYNKKAPKTYGKRKKRIVEIPISRLPVYMKLQLDHELYGAQIREEDIKLYNGKLLTDREIED